ncbi:MAG: hypothetical protein JNL67_12390 [Planctomycetaceae bacterium]|nr:hypothetical protein [Planctomycetaceae bacterium]
MIEKATEVFWRNLRALGLFDPSQIERWFGLADAPGATWLQLCQAIQQESRLTSAHLQLLASDNPATPVLVGSLLIQRPTLHPLNWDAYEAVHVKLEQHARVILLPDAGRDNVGLQGLQRARQVATLDDVQVTRIVDLETVGSRYAMVVSESSGERLSQVWANADVGIDWSDLASQLIGVVHRVHRSGLGVGVLDPLTIHYVRERNELLLDDLVSSQWINEEMIPNGLGPSEEAVLIAYRAQRARFLNAASQPLDGHSVASTNDIAHDWLECAAWLDFAAQRLETSGRSENSLVAQRLRQAAVELCEIHRRPATDFATWYRRWFGSLQVAEPSSHFAKAKPFANPWDVSPSVENPGPELDDEVIELPNDTVAIPDAPQESLPSVGVGETRSPVMIEKSSGDARKSVPTADKPKPGSLAEKQAAKRELEKRRKIVLAAAVLVPLPICLLVLLLVYLLQPAKEGVPDVANQSTGATELPDVELPTNDVLKTGTGPVADDVAKSNASKANPPSEVVKSPVKDPSANSDALNELPNSKIGDTEDEMLADLTPPATTDPQDSKKQSVPDAADTKMTSPPVDDGFIAYTHVLNELDVVGAWRDALKESADTAISRTVQLGQLNRITGKKTLLEINSSEPTIASAFRIVAKPSEQASIVQQWELQSSEAGKTLALIQTTTDGQLQMVLEPSTTMDWNGAEKLKLELYFGQRDVSHWIALGQGRRPNWSSTTGGATSEGTASETNPSLTLVAPTTPTTVAGENQNLPSTTEQPTEPVAANSDDASIPDLVFDSKSAASKTWFKDTPGFPRESVEWRFQIIGQNLKKIEKEHSAWKSLRVRSKEEAYFLDEILDHGSVVVIVEAESGERTRLKARMILLTPNGPTELKEDVVSVAIAEAEQFKQTCQLQREQINKVRAAAGEAEQKKAKLGQLDALMKEMDRYKKVLEVVAKNNDAMLEKGLAFGLVQIIDGQEQYLLKSQGFTVSEPKNE